MWNYFKGPKLRNDAFSSLFVGLGFGRKLIIIDCLIVGNLHTKTLSKVLLHGLYFIYCMEYIPFVLEDKSQITFKEYNLMSRNNPQSIILRMDN